MSKQQIQYMLYRRLMFCAYHKIKTLAEFLEATKGKQEKS
jgi:hypothetical protein